jgi:hypothetical protein
MEKTKPAIRFSRNVVILARKKAPHCGGAQTDQETLLQITAIPGLAVNLRDQAVAANI